MPGLLPVEGDAEAKLMKKRAIRVIGTVVIVAAVISAGLVANENTKDRRAYLQAS